MLPQWQDQGIGAALIHAGIEAIATRGALGCILTGNPDYYRRFGFEPAPNNVPEVESAEFFMLKPLSRHLVTGKFTFHDAFYGEV